MQKTMDKLKMVTAIKSIFNTDNLNDIHIEATREQTIVYFSFDPSDELYIDHQFKPTEDYMKLKALENVLFYYSVKYKPVEDLENKLTAAIQSIYHMLLEAMCKEREAVHLILDSVLNILPQYIGIKNMDKRFIYSNRLADALYQPRIDTLKGKTIHEVYSEDEAEIINQYDQETLEKGGYTEFSFFVESDKGVRNVKSKRKVVYDHKNDPIAIVSLNEDVSEYSENKSMINYQNDFQKELNDLSKMFLESTYDNIDEIIKTSMQRISRLLQADYARILSFDFDQQVITKSYEFSSLPRLEPFDVIKLADVPEDIMHDFLNQKVLVLSVIHNNNKKNALFELLESLKIISMAALPIVKNGQVAGMLEFDKINGNFMWGQTTEELLNTYIYLVNTHIAKLEAEHKLKMLKDQAVADNMRKSEFLSYITHEIRNPIHGMKNSIYLLNITDLSHEQSEYIDIFDISLNVLSNIVNQILDLSRIESGHIEVTYHDTVIEKNFVDIYKIILNQAKKKSLDLILDFDYQIPREILIDEQKIQQIMMNLAVNAIKFTEKGSVRFGAKLLSKEKKYCKIEFFVQDTGMGIKSKDIQQLGQKFFQSKSSKKLGESSSGLGLFITKRFLEQMNATLEVESEVGKGTLMRFVLDVGYQQTHLLDEVIHYLKSDDDQDERMIAILESMYKHVYSDVQTKSNIDYVTLYHNETEKNAHKIYLAAHNQVKDPLVLGYPFTRDQLKDKIDKHKKNVQSQIKTKHKILLVDDNAINLKVISAILTKAGYQVDSFKKGYDALEVIGDSTYDLILVDVEMPDINGYRLAKKIKEQCQHIKKVPIIAITAHTIQSVKHQDKNKSFNWILTKPVNSTDLIQTVHRYMGTIDYD